MSKCMPRFPDMTKQFSPTIERLFAGIANLTSDEDMALNRQRN